MPSEDMQADENHAELRDEWVGNMNLEVDDSKIKLSIELSDFKNLKKYEDKENFKENTGSEKFFRYGKYNIWKEILDKNQLKLLETNLFKEMVDLKYLNN